MTRPKSRIVKIKEDGGQNVKRVINSLGKDIDVASPSPQVVVQAHKSGRTDLTIIASLLKRTLIQFVVPVNSPIKSIQDLKGKKIGVTLVLATTTDVIKNKREALQRFVNAFVEGDQWAEANRVEAGKVYAQQVGIPENIGVAVETQDIPKGAYSPGIFPENNQATEDTMRLGNVIGPNYKIPWAQIVDTSFLPADLRKEIR